MTNSFKFTSQSLGALYNDLFGATTCLESELHNENDASDAPDFFGKQLERYQKHIQNMLNRGFVNFIEEGDRRVIPAKEALKTIILLLLEDMHIEAAGRRLFSDKFDKIPLFDKSDKKVSDDGFSQVLSGQSPIYLFIELSGGHPRYNLSMSPDFAQHDEIPASLRIPVSAILRNALKRFAEVSIIMQKYGK